VRGRLGRAWQLLLLLTLAWFPASRAVAGNPPPPAPGVQAPPSGPAPAAPAAGQATLYDQFDSPSTAGSVSQDSTDNRYDTRAADDFFVTTGSNSWLINAVEVVGFFSGGSGAKTVSSVNIVFYTDSAGKPGYPLFSLSSNPTSGTDSTGNFLLPLSPAVGLASDANYWVTVQGVQSTSWLWYWRKRTPQSLAQAVWRNPNDGFGSGCKDWTLITICFGNTGQDLLFRLYGDLSSNHVTPILISLDPNHAFNRTFTLTANGAGFANGAVLNWTLGNTQQFTTTFSNAGRLSATIPAASVATYGATVSVSVTNPGPCAGSCTSNTLTFSVSNPLLLPLVRR
jgi:hypothetical protein